MSNNAIKKEDFMFLLTGGVILENPNKNPTKWLTEKSWDELCLINNLSSFRGILNDFVMEPNNWKNYYDLTEPQKSPLPGIWEKKLTHFQKLLVLRIFRSDKINAAIRDLVEYELGKQYTVPPSFDLDKSYADSNCLSPLVFIL